MNGSPKMLLPVVALLCIAPGARAAEADLEIPQGKKMTLAQAIELADRRNLSLAAVRTELERADSEMYSSWAALFPVASAKATLTHHDHEEAANVGGGRIVTRPQDTLSGAIEVGVPVVNPGAWMGVSAGKVGVTMAGLTVASARQALLLTVAQAYYQALTAKSLIEVHETQLGSARRHFDIARTRLVSGVGKRIDANRAQSEVVRTREALIVAHVSFTDARDALGILTGTGGLPMPVDAPELSAPEGSEAELVSDAKVDREDLKLKRSMVELAGKQLDLSWMQFLPSLNASWQLTHQFTGLGQFGSQDRTRWTAFLVLSVPIYSQTRYADLDRGRAAVRKARIEAEDAEQKAALEVRRARRAYMTAVQKIATATEQAQLARETRALTEAEYRAGTGSSLDVTDAARVSREAEINLAARRFEAQIALLSLLRAVGSDMTALKSEPE